VTLPSGEEEYFRCANGLSTASDEACEIDDHRVGGNLIRKGSAFHYYPGNGLDYQFDDTNYATRGRVWAFLYDPNASAPGNLIASTSLDTSNGGRIRQVSAQGGSLNLYFTYGTTSPFGMQLVELDTASGGDPTRTVMHFVVANNASGVPVLQSAAY